MCYLTFTLVTAKLCGIINWLHVCLLVIFLCCLIFTLVTAKMFRFMNRLHVCLHIIFKCCFISTLVKFEWEVSHWPLGHKRKKGWPKNLLYVCQDLHQKEILLYPHRPPVLQLRKFRLLRSSYTWSQRNSWNFYWCYYSFSSRSSCVSSIRAITANLEEGWYRTWHLQLKIFSSYDEAVKGWNRVLYFVISIDP